MALIPSESLNFPDSFRAAVGWRVTTKPVPPPPISRKTEPDRDNNGQAKTQETPANRTSSDEPAVPNAVVPKSEPVKDKAAEGPTPLELKTEPAEPTETVKKEEPLLELKEPKTETKAEEPDRELEQSKQLKSAEPKQVAQEQLVTKPAAPPNMEPAPPVETEPEQSRDAMPEPSSNITTSSAGATLSGADAAALLSKIFFSPAAATTELEEIKSKARPTEIPNDPVTTDSEAESKSSPPVTSDNSQLAPAPNKELTKEFAEPNELPRKKFSISAQPAPLLSEDFGLEARTNTVNIQSPAQTKQVLDLMAAAAARGLLKAEPLSAPPAIGAAPVVKPAAEVATPISSAMKVEAAQEPPTISDEIAPGPERSVLNTPVVRTAPSATTSPSPLATVEEPSSKPAVLEPGTLPSTTSPTEDETSQVAPKTPAKIRIQPRKFKARPIPLPAADTEFSETPVTPETSVPDTIAYDEVGTEKAAAAPPLPKTDLPKPAYREWAERGMPLPKGAETAPELFTARDALNRWIRFGLGELGALTVLVVLLSYVFSHKFPDPTLKLLIFILMFAVGAVAIALPIMFIRNHPSQWQRRALNYRRDHANYL